MSNKMIRTAAILIGVVVVVGSFLLWSDFARAPVTSTQGGSVTLSVQGLYTDTTMPLASGETALQVLQDLDEQDSALQLQTKAYDGLGTLVEGMGGMHNGDNGNYWQYEVNGVSPQVGAGGYILHDGDTINWLFEASQE